MTILTVLKFLIFLIYDCDNVKWLQVGHLKTLLIFGGEIKL